MSIQETNLKAIADAIREKDGTTEPIPANDFPNRIRAIPSGGVPEGVYTITLEASDPEGGSVSGGGLVQEGMTVTVTAEVVEGYKFTGWHENGAVVSEDTAYNFTVARDRMLTAAFEVEKVSRLPEGYTEVEYISLDETTVLYSGISMHTATTRVIMDIEPQVVTGNGKCIFYARTQSGSTTYFGFLNTVQCVFGYYGSNMVGGTAYTYDFVAENRITVDADNPNKKLRIGKQEFDLTTYTSQNHNAGNILIGGMTNPKPAYVTYSGLTPTLPMKLYSMQIYRAGVLVADFVPCVNSDGVAGLYNISDELSYEPKFASASEGIITPGPAV